MNHDQRLFHLHQLMPAIIILCGLFIGMYLYFYLTTVDASVQRSLSSNNSPQSAIITTPQEEESEEPMIDQELQDILDTFEGKQVATTAVYVKDLSSGIVSSVNATTTIKAASMYKLFVAYETLLQIDEGELSLDQATGFDAGNTTIENCLDIMISVSDNPCGRALRKVIDVNEKPIPRLAELGFTGTNLAYDYPTTSAADVGLLFEKLYNQSDLTKESNDLFLMYLKNQKVRDRIPQGLPSGTEIAHKTGDLEGFAHDGGIVYHHSGDYVLVIIGGPFTKDLSSVYGDYSRVTEQIHQHLVDAEM